MYILTHIKPRQPAPGLPERSLVLSTRDILQTKHAPKPINRLQLPEVILLVMQVRRDIMTQQREKRADGEGLIATLQDVKIDRVPVEVVTQEADDAVYGDEEEDADDVPLLEGFEVVGCVEEDQGAADGEGDQAEDCAEDEAKFVEGPAFPKRLFYDVFVGERAIALHA